ELLGDAHVADHGAAVERDLAVRGDGGVDDRLHAVHVGGEGREDDALLGLHDQAAQRRDDLRLRLGHARGGRVGRVAEEQVDALVAPAAQGRQVGGAVVRRGLVQLDVARVDDEAGAGLDGHAQALRDGVVHREETQVERAALLPILLVDLDGLRADAVLLQLRLDEREGEPGRDDRDVAALLQQPRDGADVVLMAVRDDQRLDAIPLALHVGEVRQDQVDAGLVGAREEDAAVHDEQTVLVLEDRHVAADLRDAAEGDDAEAVLRGLRRLRQALRQVGALHGLHDVAAVASSAATLATLVAAALAATLVALAATATAAAVLAL